MICGFSVSDGKTRVLFDPRLSNKGALLTASKAPKREKDPSDYTSGVGAIYSPEALPMYRVSYFILLSLLLLLLFYSFFL